MFFAKRPGSWYVTSGIFGAYGPILVLGGDAGNAEALREVLDGAAEYARERKAKYVHLKALEGPKGKNDFTHPSYDRQDVWVTAFMNVGGTSEELWKSLPGPMRTKVRKAEKSELAVRWGECEASVSFAESRAMFSRTICIARDRRLAVSPSCKKSCGEFGDGTVGRPSGRSDLRAEGRDERGRVDPEACSERSFPARWCFVTQGVVYVPFVSSRSEVFSAPAE